MFLHNRVQEGGIRTIRKQRPYSPARHVVLLVDVIEAKPQRLLKLVVTSATNRLKRPAKAANGGAFAGQLVLQGVDVFEVIVQRLDTELFGRNLSSLAVAKLLEVVVQAVAMKETTKLVWPSV